MSPAARSKAKTRHARLRWAALLYLGSRGLLLAVLVGGAVAYFHVGVQDISLLGGAGSTVLLLSIMAFLVARPLRCVACRQPVLRHTKQPKHADAAKWLGISYRAQVAWEVLLRKHHHCMYCHNRCRNAAHGTRGGGMVENFGRPYPETPAAANADPIASSFGPSEMPTGHSAKSSILDPSFLSTETGRTPAPAPGPEWTPSAASLPSVLPSHASSLNAPPQRPVFPVMPVPPVAPVALTAPTAIVEAPVSASGEPARSAPQPRPFLPPSPPVSPAPSASFTPSPTMSIPAPSLPAFPFSKAVDGGPVDGPSAPVVPAAFAFPAVKPPTPLPSQPRSKPLNPACPAPFFTPAASAAPTGAAPESPFLSVVLPPEAATSPPAAMPVPLPSTAAFQPAPHPVTDFPAPPAPSAVPLPLNAPLPFVWKVPTAPVADPPPLVLPLVSSVPAAPAGSAAPVGPALPMDAIVEILRQGQQTMEEAFTAMIEQLQASARRGGGEIPTAPLTVPPFATVAQTAKPASAGITLVFPSPVAATMPFPPAAAEPPAPAPLAAFQPSAPAGAASFFPAYPPLPPVAAVPAARPIPVSEPPRSPSAFPAAAELPDPATSLRSSAAPRLRPLPAMNPAVLAEMESTLQQAFDLPGGPSAAPSAFPPAVAATPPWGPPAGFPLPAAAPVAAFPAAPAPPSPVTPWGPPGVAAAFPLPPLAVPLNNTFTPASGAGFAPPSPPAMAHSDTPPSVPAPFTFLQAVPPAPLAWPTDEPSDLPAAESPPMWTRSHTKSSLS